MTSRNLFWKYSNWNFKKRLWALVLCVAVWFFVLPVSVFIISGSSVQGYDAGGLQENMKWIRYQIINAQIAGGGGYGVIVAAMGIFLALQGSAWNNHQSRVDLYKSVPIKAAARFWYIHLNSLWFFLLSFGVNLFLANMAAGARGIWNKSFVTASLASFLMHLLLFLSSYLITLIAQNLTGNVALGFFGASFLMLLEPACNLIGQELMKNFYHTYWAVNEVLLLEKGIFSPIVPYVGMYKSVSRSGLGFAEMGNYADIWKWVLLFLLQIVVYGIIAYRLYLKRPAQTGGKSMIFPKTKPIIKCAIMIVGSLLFGVVMAGVSGKEAVWYGLFGVICGLLITQCVLQTIMEGSFKEVLSGKKSFAAAAMLSLGIYFVFVTDLTGFDTYLPKEEKVESFAIFRTGDYYYDFFNEKGNYISAEDYIMKNMEIKDEQAKQLLLSMLQKAIDNDDYYYHEKKEISAKVLSPQLAAADTVYAATAYADGDNRENLSVKFRMTDGREIVRQYYLRLDDIRACYAYLYELPAYKEGIYMILQEFVTQRFEESDSAIVSYQIYGAGNNDYHTKSQELVRKLLLAMQSDIRNRPAETVLSQPPVGRLYFSDSYDTDYMGRNLTMSLPVYENDEAVMTLLKEIDWYRQAGFLESEVAGLEIQQYTDDGKILKVMDLQPQDPLFAEAVAAICTEDAIRQVNDAGAFVEPNYSITVNLKQGVENEYGYTCMGSFLREKFPQELETAFEKIEAEKEESY